MVVKKKKDIIFLGGVGYVANLCTTFSKKTKLISFLGNLRTQKKFVLQNLKKKIDHHFLIKKNSPTIVKTRYLDEYKKNKIIGIYDLNDDSISKAEETKFYNVLKKEIKNFDIVIVTDYGHGIFTEKIRNLIQKNNQKVFLNTQINSFNRGYHSVNKYKKANTLIINESELRYELRDRNSNLINLVKKIRKKIKTNYIIVTRGNLGSLMVNCKKWTTVTCPAFNVRSIDSVGAGDTFLTLSALTLGSKLEDDLSMFISSLAASFSTNQVGNISIFNNEILKKQLSHILK
jgi:bifunctional ADP-heptose synthase (sugar kinase/adenylyltransferase)